MCASHPAYFTDSCIYACSPGTDNTDSSHRRCKILPPVLTDGSVGSFYDLWHMYASGVGGYTRHEILSCKLNQDGSKLP